MSEEVTIPVNWPEISALVEELANIMAVLPILVKDDQNKLCLSTLAQVLQYLKKTYFIVHENRDLLAACSEGPAMFRGPYPSAHEAVVEEANSFFDFLWFHLDPAGHKEACGKLLRTGFDPKLVPTHWDITKAVIVDQIEPLKGAFGEMRARIPKERYLLTKQSAAKSDDVLEILADILTKPGYAIVSYLWDRKHGATYDSLHGIPGAFRDIPSDDGVESALKRIIAKLNENPDLGVTMERSPTKRRVKLIRIS